VIQHLQNAFLSGVGLAPSSYRGGGGI